MWKQLQDFDAQIGGHTMTVRVTKSDDSLKAKYSIATGMRNDPNPFRPFLRGDLLDKKNEQGETGLLLLTQLLSSARSCIVEDQRKHTEWLAEQEASRLAALNGKTGGDPKANQGLNAKGKTQKKRDKERQKVSGG